MKQKAILPRYPNKCPVVVQRYYKETTIDAIDQNKFLVPIDMTVHGLMYIIRKRLNIQNESIAMYLFTEKGNLFATNSNISYVYDKFKDEDGTYTFSITVKIHLDKIFIYYKL